MERVVSFLASFQSQPNDRKCEPDELVMKESCSVGSETLCKGPILVASMRILAKYFRAVFPSGVWFRGV